ncbi:MAG: class I SAM-dependent methyltransferase [Minicystis sp.]
MVHEPSEFVEPVVSTELFGTRAERYAAYRPGYPDGVFRVLAGQRPPPATVADIGAGTGIFSRGLLRAGYEVTAVEPNAAMRAEAASAVHDHAFRVVAGRGEATGLPGGSIDLVTVAQAFHWLDRPAAQAELRRIARPGCRVAVVWNSRRFEASAFMRDYRQMLLDLAPRYASMKDRWSNLDADVRAFFPTGSRRFTFANLQRVDRETMIGNLLSTSYVPREGEPGHGEILSAARRLFDAHQQGGVVPFELQTILHVGCLA